jgi:hypothetical protein
VATTTTTMGLHSVATGLGGGCVHEMGAIGIMVMSMAHLARSINWSLS